MWDTLVLLTIGENLEEENEITGIRIVDKVYIFIKIIYFYY